MNSTKGIVTALAMVLALAGGAQAQYWSYGGMSGMQTQSANWADNDAYYFEVRYQGTAPQVLTRMNGRQLDISVQQAAGGPGGFMTGSSTKSIQLPMDADPSRMWRREEPGRVLLVIPRQPPMGPRW